MPTRVYSLRQINNLFCSVFYIVFYCLSDKVADQSRAMLYLYVISDNLDQPVHWCGLVQIFIAYTCIYL